MHLIFNMAHVFLSGGGNEKQSEKLDREFVKYMPHDKRMLYIPIASRGRRKFEDCFIWIKNTFSKFDFNEIDMWTDLSGKSYAELSGYGAVYIGGGNTFSLLQEFRKSGFDKLLLKFHNNNGIIYGGSAGAIFLGKDIEVAYFGGDSDENIAAITNFNGLNLVRNYAITCHYRKRDDKRIFDYAKKHGIEVVALREEVGLHVFENKIRVIGSVNAILFDENKKTRLDVDSTF